MHISKAMNAKLCEQISNEFGASQAYLAMACMFDGLALKGLAKLFRKQTDEEREHALKILDYVLEVGGDVKLAALPAPKSDFSSVKAAIDAAHKHELRVTQQIHDLVALADKEKDYASRSFLQWFVDEQVEEVSSMEHLLRIAEMAGVNLLQLESYVRHMLAPKG
ncbi:MAG: ferritin [Planctomycetes bacterium]|nr:ferritin [Planctomycetota bacterium]